MSKKNKQETPAAPAYVAPKEVNDPGLPDYSQYDYLRNPQESLLQSSVSGLNKILNDTNQGYDQYVNDLYNPVARQIESSYNKAKGEATTQAGKLGTNKSVGFMNYLAGTLEKNKADSLADAQSQANLQAYQLPSLLMQPYTTAFSTANSGLASLQDRINAAWNSTLARSQMLNNYQLNQASNLNAFNMNQYLAQLSGGKQL